MAKVGEITNSTDVAIAPSGSTILNGARVPTDDDGGIGTFWHDTAGKALWGPKQAAGRLKYTIDPAAVPVTPNTTPGDFTLGMAVQFLTPVLITALRFYRASSSTTTSRNLTLYRVSALQRTVTTTVAHETGSGWKTVPLATPLLADAGVVYITAFYTGNSYYPETISPPLTSYSPEYVTLLGGRYTGGQGFPANSASNSWFVEPEFSPPAWTKVLQSAP